MAARAYQEYVNARQVSIARILQLAKERSNQIKQYHLDAADAARDAGDITRAATIYMKVARTRDPEKSKVAKDRLSELKEEALSEAADIEKRLSASAADFSDSQLLQAALQTGKRTEFDEIRGMLNRYESLGRKYRKVPVAGKQIAMRAARQKKQAPFEAILKEPAAAELLQMAQDLQAKDEFCCAFLVLEQAAEMEPAPSAVHAQRQLKRMKADPQIVASAERCRDLQWCHGTYQKAERLLEARPTRAKELLLEIVKRAPQGSQIAMAARMKVQELN